jgi:uncharacterized protein (DUF3084 family)
VADRELKLQEREEQYDLRLDHELKALTTRESDLSSREATLAMERKDLEETRIKILARELAADIRDMHLNSREEELVDREKRLVESQLQELATAHRKLEGLQVARAGEAQKVGDFLGQTEAALVPLGFSPHHTRDPVEEVSTALQLLDSGADIFLDLGLQISLELVAQGPVVEME